MNFRGSGLPYKTLRVSYTAMSANKCVQNSVKYNMSFISLHHQQALNCKSEKCFSSSLLKHNPIGLKPGKGGVNEDLMYLSKQKYTANSVILTNLESLEVIIAMGNLCYKF